MLPSRVNDQGAMKNFLLGHLPEEDRIEIFGLNAVADNKASED
jgi:hypothetical protein